VTENKLAALTENVLKIRIEVYGRARREDISIAVQNGVYLSC